MCKVHNLPVVLLAITIFISQPACTHIPVHPPASKLLAYTVTEDNSLLSRYMPVIVIENHQKTYNLIGTPSAMLTEDNEETIYVDPVKPTIYAEIRLFTTTKSNYTNLIYRIHFEKVPGGFMPYYLGKGKNVGLIVIVTLNQRNQPILYTTVHTCGCYLAFAPTSHMPPNAFPSDWDTGRQSVDFENLPGLLDYDRSGSKQEKTMLLIRDGSHRVKDIWLSPLTILQKYQTVTAHVKPMGELKKLSLKTGKTTSFFELSGPRTDYVKGSEKLREWLLMSWWVFDSRVGEDKILGKNKTDGILFYTSLKPWAREKSDLRDFSAFLSFWNWNL